MAHEKQYTAKQAASAVLEKVGEILKKSKAMQTTLAKSEKMPKGWGKEDVRPGSMQNKGASVQGKAAVKKAEEFKCEKCEVVYKSEAPHERCDDHKVEVINKSLQIEFESLKSLLKAEPKGEIHPHEKQAGEEEKVGARVQPQQDPQHNPKEEAEGNNELAGTTPTQVGQDGKNMPGGDEIKGHLKLAKFVGRMDYKRQTKQNQAKVVSQQHVGNAQTASSAQHNSSIGKQ